MGLYDLKIWPDSGKVASFCSECHALLDGIIQSCLFLNGETELTENLSDCHVINYEQAHI